ncbi:pyridoxamine 5'-phosphate oxidase family protein [Rhodococcus sp. WS4]|nr:pyridoxamine 5'-phosphate oxidase family protein [Rhodococcus sp. WS4]
MTQPAPSERTKVRVRSHRGHYDTDTVYGIIDEALVAHVGFNRQSDGHPCVIPTAHCRIGDKLYFHGSNASTMLRDSFSMDVSIAVSIIDGLTVARSAINNSMDYRSVVVFGPAHQVVDDEEKLQVCKALVEHVIPGRWNDVRHPTKKELRTTSFMAVSLAEASAKIRQGPPIDDEEDYALPTWGGTLPIRAAYGPLVPDDRVPEGMDVPEYLTQYRREGTCPPWTRSKDDADTRDKVATQ